MDKYYISSWTDEWYKAKKFLNNLSKFMIYHMKDDYSSWSDTRSYDHDTIFNKQQFVNVYYHISKFNENPNLQKISHIYNVSPDDFANAWAGKTSKIRPKHIIVRMTYSGSIIVGRCVNQNKFNFDIIFNYNKRDSDMVSVANDNVFTYSFVVQNLNSESLKSLLEDGQDTYILGIRLEKEAIYNDSLCKDSDGISTDAFGIQRKDGYIVW